MVFSKIGALTGFVQSLTDMLCLHSNSSVMLMLYILLAFDPHQGLMAASDCMLMLMQDNGVVESQAESSVGQEAAVLHFCRHPNVVPITLLGLKGPASPDRPFSPSQVAYFGMPMADMSLRKSLG